MDDYNRGGHSKYSLKVHLIFVTKYRKKIFLLEKLASSVKQFLYEDTKKNGYNIMQMEVDKDHIHILLEYSQKVSVSDIVKQLKQYSTVHIRCGIITKNIYPSNIGNNGFFGQMDILRVV